MPYETNIFVTFKGCKTSYAHLITQHWILFPRPRPGYQNLKQLDISNYKYDQDSYVNMSN